MDKKFNEPSQHLDELAYAVIGAAIEVHRWIGPGYLESVYQEALAIELRERRIPFKQQLQISIPYKGHVIGRTQLDFLVEDQLVVELKAVESLLQVHRAQALSYLRASGLQLGLLLNFHTAVMKNGIQRVVWDPDLLETWRLGG
jgi:GxxExxY protein